MPEGTPRQCAWCLAVMDAVGVYSVRLANKIKAATHGICPACKLAMLAEIESQPTLVAA